MAGPTAVLDASAVLAWLQEEPGADVVDAVMDEAAISAVNAAEVLHKLIKKGMASPEAQQVFDQLCLPVLDFTERMSRDAAKLSHHTGLSLGDRACLATGIALGVPAFTSEQLWGKLDSVGEVRLIRNAAPAGI